MPWYQAVPETWGSLVSILVVLCHLCVLCEVCSLTGTCAQLKRLKRFLLRKTLKLLSEKVCFYGKIRKTGFQVSSASCEKVKIDLLEKSRERCAPWISSFLCTLINVPLGFIFCELFWSTLLGTSKKKVWNLHLFLLRFIVCRGDKDFAWRRFVFMFSGSFVFMTLALMMGAEAGPVSLFWNHWLWCMPAWSAKFRVRKPFLVLDVAILFIQSLKLGRKWEENPTSISSAHPRPPFDCQRMMGDAWLLASPAGLAPCCHGWQILLIKNVLFGEVKPADIDLETAVW